MTLNGELDSNELVLTYRFDRDGELTLTVVAKDVRGRPVASTAALHLNRAGNAPDAEAVAQQAHQAVREWLYGSHASSIAAVLKAWHSLQKRR